MIYYSLGRYIILKTFNFFAVNLVPFGPEVGDHKVHPGFLTAGQTIDLYMYFPFYGGLYNYTTVQKYFKHFLCFSAFRQWVHVLRHSVRPRPDHQCGPAGNGLAPAARSGHDGPLSVQTAGEKLWNFDKFDNLWANWTLLSQKIHFLRKMLQNLQIPQSSNVALRAGIYYRLIMRQASESMFGFLKFSH